MLVEEVSHQEYTEGRVILPPANAQSNSFRKIGRKEVSLSLTTTSIKALVNAVSIYGWVSYEVHLQLRYLGTDLGDLRMGAADEHGGEGLEQAAQLIRS